MALVSDTPAVIPTAPNTAISRRVSIALGLVVMAFAGTWVTFPTVWLDNRTHGFMAAGLALWVLWTRRSALGGRDMTPGYALPLVAAASMLWAIGQILSAQVIHQFALAAVLWLWLLAVAGEHAAFSALPAVAVFSLALPIWEVLMWPLQLAAATVSAIVTKIVGVQATVSNEVINLRWGTLIVAGSCSGLGFFLTAVTLGCAYALLFVRSHAAQRRIVALAALMAVLANWVRVVGLVLIADATRMTSPLMKDHELFGWGIFFAAMAIWFLLAGRIERAQLRWSPSAVANTPSDGTGAAVDGRLVAAPWVLAVATLLAVSGPVFLYGVRLIPNAGTPPAQIHGISASPSFGLPVDGPLVQQPEAWRPAFEAPSFSRREVWVSGTDSIRVDQLAYFEEHQGAELISDANRVAPDSVLIEERVIGPLDGNMRTVRQTVVREGRHARMVWYWYRVAGIETSSAGKAKLLAILAFIRREEGGEATFVSAPCREGDCSAAISLLYRFVTGKPLPSSVPRAGG